VRAQVDRCSATGRPGSQRSNGNTATGRKTAPLNRCDELKPACAYDRHRGTCRLCRQQLARDREHRAHAADDDGEGPRSGPTADE
jgi:hypothetical protein